MPRPFKSVQAAHPGRSVFDLSYSKLLTCDMGKLYPVMCDEVVPGDKFKIGNQVVVRMMPLVSPVLHEIKMTTHYYFVPYRLLWSDWETFITRGIDGDQEPTQPRWNPTGANSVGSLWDYFGFPTGVVPTGRLPVDFPKRAYNLVWNEYYRDESLQSEIDITTSQNILLRNWTKDYFTSALEWQQRGTAPALPISGVVSAVFPNDINLLLDQVIDKPSARQTYMGQASASDNILNVFVTPASIGDSGYYPMRAAGSIDKDDLNVNTVDLTGLTTFNVSDLRLAFQIQKWMERNARSGARYVEFLHSVYGTSPKDERLQRPEYIGGSIAPLIISEVLKTSSTDTESPQGNMAGHGISVSQEYCGSYYAQEFGLIIGIMSIMPVPMYQQGINRQWLRQSNFDYYAPAFANLSEQAIENVEIYATDVENDNKNTFGYQGRYDEMRYKPNMVCGLMRTDFDFWHLGRIFGSAPHLNEDFIKCVPDTRIFAVENQPGFVVHFGNVITAVRPLPIVSEPGLIDHN